MPLNISLGDEEIALVEELEDASERARRSHYDDSHINPALTYNQRIALGCMIQELAGDV